MPVRPEDFDASPNLSGATISPTEAVDSAVAERERGRRNQATSPTVAPPKRWTTGKVAAAAAIAALCLMCGIVLLPPGRPVPRWFDHHSHQPIPMQQAAKEPNPPRPVNHPASETPSAPHDVPSNPAAKDGGSTHHPDLASKDDSLKPQLPFTPNPPKKPLPEPAPPDPVNPPPRTNEQPNPLPKEEPQHSQPAPSPPSDDPSDPKLVHRNPPVNGNPAASPLEDQPGHAQHPQNLPGEVEQPVTPAHPPAPYVGPSSGTLTWDGDVQGSAFVIIENGRANSGNLSGSPLPGVLCMVQLSDPKHFSVAVAPAPSNQWRKIVLNVHGKGEMKVKLSWVIP
jgi:hypothetical protein